MAEIYSAPEITTTYYFKVKNIPIFNVDYKIPDFSSHQTMVQMVQLLQCDSFPESDGFLYSSENETNFIIADIPRTHPHVTTKHDQVLSRDRRNQSD